jgi:HlyD family secretion protein
VWVLTNGQPAAVSLNVGASDGRMTEVTGGELQAGMRVITESLATQK